MFKVWLKIKWFVIAFLILMGLFLLFNQNLANFWWLHQSPQKVESLQKHKPKKSEVSYNFSKVKALSSMQILSSQMHQKNFIGSIYIPDINLNVPISQGVSSDSLAVGAGTLRSDVHFGEGNFAVAGHNMGNGSQILFGPLYTSAKVGQLAYVTDLKHVYIYNINVVKQIAATDVNVIKNTSNKILTMTTCNDDGSARILVRGSLLHVIDFSDASQYIQSGLSKYIKK